MLVIGYFKCGLVSILSRLLMDSILEKFLARNTALDAGMLPLVHTTRSYMLGDIRQSHTIEAGECTVFRGEKLNYFFVGRPAYKYLSKENQSPYWEFPTCFIFDFSVVSNIARIFPFDSGAFRSGLYPDYIKKMNIDHFNAGNDISVVGKLIGSFFGNVKNYLKLVSDSEKDFCAKFSLGPFDAEVKALHRLSSEVSAENFDDRRLTVEIQNKSDLNLLVNSPMAIVVPIEYLDDDEFMSVVNDRWGCEVLSYEISTLNIGHVVGQIYQKVFDFYREKGFIDGL